MSTSTARYLPFSVRTPACRVMLVHCSSRGEAILSLACSDAGLLGALQASAFYKQAAALIEDWSTWQTAVRTHVDMFKWPIPGTSMSCFSPLQFHPNGSFVA